MPEIRKSLSRIKNADPVTFWASMIGGVTGTVAMILAALQLMIRR
jgi:hypothetical protein